MKHAIGPRREIGIRTIFNILGPLANPAGTEVQILGVFRKDLTAVMAEVLGKLGCRRAMVVHGEDGMDEITTTGSSHIAEWANGGVRQYTVHPEDFGIPVSTVDKLLGGDAEENARIILELLEGKKGSKRDIVLLNAGAALHAAGSADTIEQGIELARQAIDDGVEYLLHGHTHEVRDERVGPTRVINPGALFRASRYTAAVLEPETDRLEILELHRSTSTRHNE